MQLRNNPRKKISDHKPGYQNTVSRQQAKVVVISRTREDLKDELEGLQIRLLLDVSCSKTNV